MESKRGKIHYAWLILFALCIIRSLSAAGINNTGGLFLKPAADELGIGVGTISIYFSVSSVATLIFMPIGGKLLRKYPVKPLAAAAVILQAVSFAALSYMDSVWAWYILAVPLGVGGAFLVNLLGPILLHRWFASHAGTALGLLMASAGLFGIVIQPIAGKWIETRGWRNTYLSIGVLVLAAALIFILLFLKDSPKDKGILPYGSGQAGASDKDNSAHAKGVAWAEARKAKIFYLLLLFMVAITAFGSFQQHIATYGHELNYTSGQVGIILSIGMAGSTIGAIFIGLISDRIGAFSTTIIILMIMFASVAAFLMGGISFYVFAAGSFLLGLSGMGIPVLAPVLTREFFGDRDYETIYSNIMMGAPLATILLLPLYGFIYDLTGSYLFVLYLLLAFIAAGAVCIWGCKRNQI